MATAEFHSLWDTGHTYTYTHTRAALFFSASQQAATPAKRGIKLFHWALRRKWRAKCCVSAAAHSALTFSLPLSASVLFACSQSVCMWVAVGWCAVCACCCMYVYSAMCLGVYVWGWIGCVCVCELQKFHLETRSNFFLLRGRKAHCLAFSFVCFLPSLSHSCFVVRVGCASACYAAPTHLSVVIHPAAEQMLHIFVFNLNLLLLFSI